MMSTNVSETFTPYSPAAPNVSELEQPETALQEVGYGSISAGIAEHRIQGKILIPQK